MSTHGALRRTPTGRFAPTYSDRDLLRAVQKAVQLYASKDGALTMAGFDRARAAIGYPDAPTADQVANRLEVGWTELCERLWRGADVDRWVTPGDRRRSDPRAGADKARRTFFTMRLIVNKLGRSPKDLAEIEQVIEILARADDGRRRGGRRLRDVLLSGNQMVKEAGGLDSLFALAGITRRAPRSRRGLSIEDAMVAFFVRHGDIPTRTQLREFARFEDFALEAESAPYSDYRRAALQQIEGGSRPVGSGATVIRVADYFPKGTFGAFAPVIARKRGRRNYWTRARIVAALIEYLDICDATGATPSQRHYRSLKVEHPNWPAPATVTRFGKLHDLLADARRLRGHR